MMARSPPLSQIAQIAILEREKSPAEVGDILDVDAQLKYDALFVSEDPPIDIPRAKDRDQVATFEQTPE
jgi:hypothetical protein